MKVVKTDLGYGIRPNGFSPGLYKLARLVPGMQWDKTRNIWRGSTDAVEATVRLLQKHKILIDVSDLPSASDVGDPIIPIAEKNLREYQKSGVRFLVSRGNQGVILGDEMGLGKTATAITAIRALSGRTVVICPSYVKGVWYNDLDGGQLGKWWPEAAKDGWVQIAKGTKAGDVKIDSLTKILVINYDILHAWEKAIVAWGPRVCCFDEGQYLMTENSRRSRSAQLIAGCCNIRWVLTGTPVPNRIRDLWGILAAIQPGRWGRSFFDFGLRYCGGQKVQVTTRMGPKDVWQFDGATNLDELNLRLRWSMLRRTTAEVALELPPKTRQVVWVEVPAGAGKGWEKARNATALRACLDKAADGKLNEALALVRGAVAENCKVVAFCYRVTVAKWLAGMLTLDGKVEVGLIHGGVTNKARLENLMRLKKTEGPAVLIATLDSCSTGVDLSFASRGVFVEITHDPQELLQAEKRLDRPGQTRPTTFQFLMARGTADEIIASRVVGKLALIEAAVGASGDETRETSGRKFLAPSADDVLEEIFAGLEGHEHEKAKSASKSGTATRRV